MLCEAQALVGARFATRKSANDAGRTSLFEVSAASHRHLSLVVSRLYHELSMKSINKGWMSRA